MDELTSNTNCNLLPYIKPLAMPHWQWAMQQHYCNFLVHNHRDYLNTKLHHLNEITVHSYSVGLFTLFSSHDCSCPLAPRKSFDILALYKSDYYYYY